MSKVIYLNNTSTALKNGGVKIVFDPLSFMYEKNFLMPIEGNVRPRSFQQYFTVTSPTVFSQYKTKKISNAGSCTQGNVGQRCFQ